MFARVLRCCRRAYKGVIAPSDSGLYWRVTPIFNTSSEKYGWLNHKVFVGKSK
ncbi:MAG: hypothetical protein CMQ21_13230 [Gammaproteobacteria bacterium]|nr:hypothetical protein [Gammaproteobacteria bacterium]